MTTVINIPLADWHQQCPTAVAVQEHALRALEEGNVLFFPQLSFSVGEIEAQFPSLATGAKSKNISLDITTGKLSGSSLGEAASRRPLRRFPGNP